jgi:hypothetical protein
MCGSALSPNAPIASAHPATGFHLSAGARFHGGFIAIGDKCLTKRFQMGGAEAWLAEP